MEQPIIVQYRWTADAAIQAAHYHLLHVVHPIIRVGANVLFAFCIAVGVFRLILYPIADKSSRLRALVELTLGFYWFVLRPLVRRWMIRRRFKKQTDGDREVTWEFSEDKIRFTSALGTGEHVWGAYTKIVPTPGGILIYAIDKMYTWLPRSGFVNDKEFSRFIELSAGKIPRHFDVT
jgi:hypothetical protein